MGGRAVHDRKGDVTISPYGLPGQNIYSISRSLINRILLDEVCKLPNVHVYFDATFESLTADGVLTISFSDGAKQSYTPCLVIGADGAHSSVRHAMSTFTRQNFSRQFITHGYKELLIPATVTGDYALPHYQNLHIWPRGSFMLIALPNLDSSFTSTVFAPFEVLHKLDNEPHLVHEWFANHFPDALPLLPDLADQWRTKPTSSLVDCRVSPLSAHGKVLLLGDAAHATVPFYGQGMNAGMEDCLIFAELMDKHPEKSLPELVSAYDNLRQPAGKSLCELSLANYDEMRAKVASPLFRLKFRLESWLSYLFPKFFVSQYGLVSFSRVPYNEIQTIVCKQNARVHWILRLLFGTAAAGGLFATYLFARENGYLLRCRSLFEPSGMDFPRLKWLFGFISRLFPSNAPPALTNAPTTATSVHISNLK